MMPAVQQDAFYSSPPTKFGGVSRVAILSVATLFVNYIPASNFISPVGFHIAERALYLPSLGFVLLISTALCYLLKRASSQKSLLSRYVWAAAVVFLFLTQSLKTWQRAQEWSTMERLTRLLGTTARAQTKFILSTKPHIALEWVESECSLVSLLFFLFCFLFCMCAQKRAARESL